MDIGKSENQGFICEVREMRKTRIILLKDDSLDQEKENMYLDSCRAFEESG